MIGNKSMAAKGNQARPSNTGEKAEVTEWSCRETAPEGLKESYSIQELLREVWARLRKETRYIEIVRA